MNPSALLSPTLVKLISSTVLPLATKTPTLADRFGGDTVVGKVPTFGGSSLPAAPVVANVPASSDIVAGTNYPPNMTMPSDDGEGVSRKVLIIGGAAALAIVAAVVVVKLKKKKR